ncbi:MAG: serine hydrolase domain-containing protein [Saprospiraceae bacterium]
MNHTTGFFDVITDQGFYLQVLNDPTKFWSADDLLKFVYHKKADFEFDPANNSGYSNTNYLLLSKIIEKVTAAPHHQYVKEKIIDKLKLNSTIYHWHENLPVGNIAQGYFDLYNNNSILNLSNWNTGSGNGYGGIYSTVEDLATFIQALYQDKTLLNEQSLDQMLVFHKTIETRKLLGVACFKDFIDIGDPSTDYAYGHRGRDLAYTADLNYFSKHSATLAIMCNYGTDSSSDLKDVYIEFRDEIARKIIEN